MVLMVLAVGLGLLALQGLWVVKGRQVSQALMVCQASKDNKDSQARLVLKEILVLLAL
jgi:hypothetical protein